MKYTPEEAARLLANRINQPHYIAAIVRRCLLVSEKREKRLLAKIAELELKLSNAVFDCGSTCEKDGIALKEQIPEQFYKQAQKPNATNVGELVDQLRRLPADLPVEMPFSEGVDLVVSNVSLEDPHLSFEGLGEG